MIPWLLTLGKNVFGAYDRWVRDDGGLLAAAVAYYVGLSFYPLLMVLISGMGWLLKQTTFGQNWEQQFFAVLADQLSPVLVAHIRELLDQVKDKTGVSGPVGLGMTCWRRWPLLFSSTAPLIAFGACRNRRRTGCWRGCAPWSSTGGSHF